jgi:hypothetical protein
LEIVVFISDFVIAKSSYYSDADDMDLDAYMELMKSHQTEKRGWCRPGFTMNPVLNRCVPTMRAVRISAFFFWGGEGKNYHLGPGI